MNHKHQSVTVSVNNIKSLKIGIYLSVNSKTSGSVGLRYMRDASKAFVICTSPSTDKVYNLKV